MLSFLHIENVAVIEKADIEFQKGLNVLTGETGAGKSIIIDAVGALTGGRVSKELVRAGSEYAIVSAEIELCPELKDWLRENDISAEDEDTLLISRRISAEGKNSCRIGGVPAGVAQLRELGELLFDIHGQNDGRKLLSEANHRAYLDNYAGITWEVLGYKELYNTFRESLKKADELRKGEKDKELKVEDLKRRIDEISSAGVKKNEYETLMERRSVLKNAGKLIGMINRAYRAMYGDMSENGALALITDAAEAVESASGVAAGLSALSAALNDLRYNIEDITEQLGDYKRSLDFSPDELETIESRLALLERLERRYGSYDEMNGYLKNAQNELEDMEYMSERLEILDAQVEKYRTELKNAAQSLSELRTEAALRLERRIADELNGLSMPGVRFNVDISTKKDFDEYGRDSICFLMSANTGEALGKISKIASGGELSRIMLAMKTVLSLSDNTGTLIFDEIDTGVSGIAAQRVGEKLYDLAREKQILCVTHLPQIAVMADRQFSIEKKQSEGRTYTEVLPLDLEGRKRELARLIGGENVTGITLSGAAELLVAAERYKKFNHAHVQNQEGSILQ